MRHHAVANHSGDRAVGSCGHLDVGPAHRGQALDLRCGPDHVHAHVGAGLGDPDQSGAVDGGVVVDHHDHRRQRRDLVILVLRDAVLDLHLAARGASQWQLRAEPGGHELLEFGDQRPAAARVVGEVCARQGAVHGSGVGQPLDPLPRTPGHRRGEDRHHELGRGVQGRQLEHQAAGDALHGTARTCGAQRSRRAQVTHDGHAVDHLEGPRELPGPLEVDGQGGRVEVGVIDRAHRSGGAQSQSHSEEARGLGPAAPQHRPEQVNLATQVRQRRGAVQPHRAFALLGFRQLGGDHPQRGVEVLLLLPQLFGRAETLVHVHADHEQRAQADEHHREQVAGHREQHEPHDQRRDHRHHGKAHRVGPGRGHRGAERLRLEPRLHAGGTVELDIGARGLDRPGLAGAGHADHRVPQPEDVGRPDERPGDPHATGHDAVGRPLVDDPDRLPHHQARMPLGDQRVGEVDLAGREPADVADAGRQVELAALVGPGQDPQPRHRRAAVTAQRRRRPLP